MAKVSYKFDIETFEVKKDKPRFWDILKRIISISASGLVFAVVVIFLAYNFFDSPKEKMLEREIAQYELQYQIINDKVELMEKVLLDLQEKDDNIYRVIFEAEPISASIRKAGYGGSNRYEHLEGFKNSEVIVNTTKKLDEVARQMYIQSKSFDEVFDIAKNKEKMLACIPAIQPIKNDDLRRISSYYGYRTDPIYKVRKFHAGLDFSAPTGTEIYSPGDGKVIKVVKSRRGYGNTIYIDHGFNYVTKYSHLSKFLISKGQKVKRGQVIGLVGNTGKSTAPHLHYEVQKNGKAVNPIYYFFNDLTPEEFELILELSQLPSQSMD
jgi:murein DD-endopeptidase MepM/ murein hydrolase activator NlpD